MGHTGDGPPNTSNWHPQVHLGRNTVEIAALETELSQLRDRIMDLEEALKEEVDQNYKSQARIKELEIDLNEFAYLKVAKDHIPPGASLVVCYDDGSGVPVLDDVRYPGFVVVMTNDGSKCGLNDETCRGQCCCICRHHRPDHSHPCTDGDSIMHQRGWICIPPEFDGRVFSGWAKHGLCEMFGKEFPKEKKS